MDIPGAPLTNKDLLKLTRRLLEINGCVFIIMAADAPVLKHKAISIHSDDFKMSNFSEQN